jgi:hypothetical protein
VNESGPAGVRLSVGQPEHVVEIVPLPPRMVESPAKGPELSAYVPLVAEETMLTGPNARGIGAEMVPAGNASFAENDPDSVLLLKEQPLTVIVSLPPAEGSLTITTAVTPEQGKAIPAAVSERVKPVYMIDGVA